MKLTNYNAAAAKLLPLGVCAALVVAALISRQVAPENTLTTVLLILAAVLVPVGILPALIMPFFAIFWVELGDELVVRTLLGTRRIDWSRVGGVRTFTVQSEVSIAHVIPVPVARHRFLEFELMEGKRYRVKVPEAILGQVDGVLAPRGFGLRRG